MLYIPFPSLHPFRVHRVEPVLYLSRVPFVFAEVIIIIQVNDGEFALRQRYSPEGVPVAHPPIQKDRQDTYPLKPGRNGNYKMGDFGCPLCPMSFRPKPPRLSSVEDRNGGEVEKSTKKQI